MKCSRCYDDTPDYGEPNCPEPGCVLRDGHPSICEIYLSKEEEKHDE